METTSQCDLHCIRWRLRLTTSTLAALALLLTAAVLFSSDKNVIVHFSAVDDISQLDLQEMDLVHYFDIDSDTCTTWRYFPVK